MIPGEPGGTADVIEQAHSDGQTGRRRPLADPSAGTAGTGHRPPGSGDRAALPRLRLARRDLPDRPRLPATGAGDQTAGGRARSGRPVAAVPAPGPRRGGADRPLLRHRAAHRHRSRRLFPRSPAPGTAAARRAAVAPHRARAGRARERDGRGRAVRTTPALSVRGDQRHRRHGDPHRRRQQAHDALAPVHADAAQPAAFPGMAALLQALHGGRSGHEDNPMLYVSRAPWSIYEVLDEFFRLHRDPDRPDPVPARMGPDAAESAAAARARPQARADPQHAGALSRPAVRADRRQRPA